MNNRITLLVLPAVLIAAVVSGCVQEVSDHGIEMPSPTPTPTSKGTTPTQSAPSTGMEVDLSISNAPALNQTAELTCTITSISDAHNTTAQITLPEGLVLVSGNLYWTGDIIVPEEEKRKHPRPNRSDPDYDRLCEEYVYPKGRVEFSAVVKTVEVGHWNLVARANGEGIYGSGIDRLYISVFEDEATVSDRLPLAKDWAVSKGCVVVNKSEIPPRIHTPGQIHTPSINTEKPVEHGEVNLRPIPNFTAKNRTR